MQHRRRHLRRISSFRRGGIGVRDFADIRALVFSVFATTLATIANFASVLMAMPLQLNAARVQERRSRRIVPVKPRHDSNRIDHLTFGRFPNRSQRGQLIPKPPSQSHQNHLLLADHMARGFLSLYSVQNHQSGVRFLTQGNVGKSLAFRD